MKAKSLAVRNLRGLRRSLSRVRHCPRELALEGVLNWRSYRFRAISTNRTVFHEAITTGGVLSIGAGNICATGARLGYFPSPGALSHYVHLEARTSGSSITIGEGTTVNNGSVMISEGPGIVIGSNVLIGPDVMIFDSDFHHLDVARRGDTPPAMGAVRIGDEAFIGARSIILKGVTIGEGAVIGAGTVVARDIGEGEVVTGSAVQVIRSTTHVMVPSVDMP